MTAVLSDLYLRTELVFWPILFLKLLAETARVIYAVMVWFPRIILALIAQKPSMIVELVAMASALLFAVWTRDLNISVSWKVISCMQGIAHLLVLVLGSWEGRVKAMITSTVFWTCLMFAFLPRKFVLSHVFLIPLCWAYGVTTLSLLKHCDDRRN